MVNFIYWFTVKYILETKQMNNKKVEEIFGEPISVYTSQQAVEGILGAMEILVKSTQRFL